ncbi:MAG: hypothetical protein ACLFP2_04410 [Candidatus Woesearchaeota archaeon]
MKLENQIQNLVNQYEEYITFPISREDLPDLLKAPEQVVKVWYAWRQDTLEVEENQTTSDRLLVCALASNNQEYAEHIINRLTDVSLDYTENKIIFQDALFELEPLVKKLKKLYKSQYKDDILTPLATPNKKPEVEPTRKPEAENMEEKVSREAAPEPSPRTPVRDSIDAIKGYVVLDDLKRAPLFFKPWVKTLQKSEIEMGKSKVRYNDEMFTIESLYTDKKGNMLYAKTPQGYLGELSFNEDESLVAGTKRASKPHFALDEVYSPLHDDIIPITKVYLCHQLADEFVRIQNVARAVFVPEYDYMASEIL